MEYKGKLYGKVGDSLVPLEATTDDFERLEKQQEQHDRELIELINYYEHLTPVEKCSAYPNGDGSLGVYPTPPEEIIRRFKKDKYREEKG